MANSQSETPKIYRFANATVLKIQKYNYSGEISLQDNGAKVLESTVLSEEVLSQLRSNQLRVFAATSEDVFIQRSETSQEVVSYLPVDEKSVMRELDAKSFEKLSANFQKMYQRKLAEPVETLSVIEHELQSMSYDLTDEELLGAKPLTVLHGVVNEIRDQAVKKLNRYSYASNDNKPRARLERVLPIKLQAEELMRTVSKLAYKVIPNRGYAASVKLEDYHHLPLTMNIDFYVNAYQGETRKVLDKKRDGRPYADGRGRFVQDMPATAGRAVISVGELGDWWSSVEGNKLSDEQKLETLTALTRSLWQVQESS